MKTFLLFLKFLDNLFKSSVIISDAMILVLKDIPWFLFLCFLSTCGHFLFIKALETAQASVLQPFIYLQLFFDNNGVLLPILEIEQKVKLLDPVYKDVEFIIKEQLSTNRFILLTKSFNHNFKLTVTRDHITI